MGKYLLIIVSTVLLCSCASTHLSYEKTASGILDTYIGKKFPRAIKQFGPLDNVYSDGNDGRALEWLYRSHHYSPGIAYTTSTFGWDEFYNTYNEEEVTIYRPPRRYSSTRFIQFYVHKNGTIYHYRHNVLSPAQIEAKQNEKDNFWLVYLGASFVGAILLLLTY